MARGTDDRPPAAHAGAARHGWRPLLVGIALGVLATALVGFVVVPVLALTHRQDLPFERAYAATAVSLVVQLRAGDAPNPLAGDPGALERGRISYTGSCAICHGAAGDGRGSLGPATYPRASDLTAPRVVSRSDAQLFWITKHGLSFTAMPAFGEAYRDTDIWAIVSHLRALQRGRVAPLIIPEPTDRQLARADPLGEATERGAAVFFAQGCHRCHGPEGDAPASLALRGRAGTHVVRSGRPGMPRFGRDRIGDAQLADLGRFLGRFAEPDREREVAVAPNVTQR